MIKIINGRIIGSSFSVDAAMDIVPGYRGVNKFGRAVSGIQTTNTDIWDQADATPTKQIWVAPIAARTHTIASDSASDTDGGSGARTIRVFGLTSWDKHEVSEDIILNTGSPPVTTRAYVIIHRMKMLTHGVDGPNVGNITATATTDNTVTAQITAGHGQTLMAIYGIPSLQNGYVTSFDVNSHNVGNPATVIETDFSMLVNEHPDVTTSASAFLIKGNVGMIAAGSSVFTKNYDPPLEIEGPAIIKFQAIATLADTEGVAEFDLYLVDN